MLSRLSDRSPTVPVMATERDLAILRLANALYRYEAHRLAEAQEKFDLNANRFWATVNRLIDEPEVAVAAPDLVLPLRRQREQRGQLKRAG